MQGPVSTGMGDRVRVQFPVRDIYHYLGKQSETQITQPGYLSWVGAMIEYQPKGDDALRLRSKAGMVHVWVACKTV